VRIRRRGNGRGRSRAGVAAVAFLTSLLGIGAFPAAAEDHKPAQPPVPAPAPSPAPPQTTSPPKRPGVDPRPSRREDPDTTDEAKHDTGPVDIDKVLEALAEKAMTYESIALRFICVEDLRGSQDRSDNRKYDFMYVESEAQRYKAYRQRHSDKENHSGPEVEVDTPFPDSYSWTLIFARNRQHLFKFKYLGDDWFSLRRAYVIEFTAPLPYATGQTIYEWSGKVWVDAENFNFLKVEAEPTNQEERLKQMLKDYRTATRFLVFSMGHRPIGAHYEITFLNTYQKLSLPDQADYRQFTLDLEGNAELDTFETLRYSEYQFFGVELHDRFLK
jgi:hypothetical protein